MAITSTPMRWPSLWQNASELALLNGTCFNSLVVDNTAGLQSIVDGAKEKGIQVVSAASPAPNVKILAGDWPGVKLSRKEDKDVASSGPTGAPWVDSNGWKIRLAHALHAESEVWIDAKPPDKGLPVDSYVLAVADAATYGARWIVTLDDQLAAGIAARNQKALEIWQKLAEASRFFSSHKQWCDYTPEAVIGVVSDFSPKNEALTNEVLNLLGRTNEQYSILPKDKLAASELAGLKAVLYVDEDPPTPELRKQISTFVQAGGMLITGPIWGDVPTSAKVVLDHPRFAVRASGTGKIAMAKPGGLDDPFLVANDSVILVSHRHDLVRFWNGGALASYLTTAPDRKHALLQLLFYARELNGKTSLGGPDSATVRVAGRYAKATLQTLDQTSPRAVHMEPGKDHVEIHLPALLHYSAIELEG